MKQSSMSTHNTSTAPTAVLPIFYKDLNWAPCQRALDDACSAPDSFFYITAMSEGARSIKFHPKTATLTTFTTQTVSKRHGGNQQQQNMALVDKTPAFYEALGRILTNEPLLACLDYHRHKINVKDAVLNLLIIPEGILILFPEAIKKTPVPSHAINAPHLYCIGIIPQAQTAHAMIETYKTRKHLATMATKSFLMRSPYKITWTL